MTSLIFLETLVSLTAQVTLLIVVVTWTQRRRLLGLKIDRSCVSLHTSILALTASASFLPHFRTFTWSGFYPNLGDYQVVSGVSAVGRICAGIWLTGAIAMLAACAGGLIRSHLLVRGAGIDNSLKQRLLVAMPGLASELRNIEFRVTKERVGPFCVQFHRPVICLPTIVLRFPLAEQLAIVRHELAHLQLQHPLELFLQRVVEVIYWYHPLVWRVSRQAAAARECCCDRVAVKSRSDVADYLRSILRLIESQVNAAGRLHSGLRILGSESLISRRARLLVDSFDYPIQLDKRWRPTGVMLIAFFACMVIWLPVNPGASRRASWSPWPSWSAIALNAVGIAVRDYEVDAHRLISHHR